MSTASRDPVKLLVALTDVTDHVMALDAAGDVGPEQSTPTDADLAASLEALEGIRSLVTSLGGGLARKTSVEHGQGEGAVTRQEVEKTLAAFEDGIVGRSFVAGAWPLAERWLANKELRKFRIKYGEVVVDLRGPEDVDRALELMRDAVPVPRPKKKAKKPAAKARAKKGAAKARAKKVAKKGRAKTSAKPKAKKRTKAAKKRSTRQKR